MIFRDDDLFFNAGKLPRFKQIHNLFNKYKVTHTIAVVAKDIEKDPALIQYIKKQKNIDIQVHCWEHVDTTLDYVKFSNELPKAIEMIKRVFNVTPTVFYPPWNKSDLRVEHIARQNGLRVSNKKISIENYLAGMEGDVINFHFWAAECYQLEDALIKYT